MYPSRRTLNSRPLPCPTPSHKARQFQEQVFAPGLSPQPQLMLLLSRNSYRALEGLDALLAGLQEHLPVRRAYGGYYGAVLGPGQRAAAQCQACRALEGLQGHLLVCVGLMGDAMCAGFGVGTKCRRLHTPVIDPTMPRIPCRHDTAWHPRGGRRQLRPR